jgi:GntR family transcriptional regulator
MLSFPIHLQPGQAIYEQIVQAVKRALATGRLKPGDRFPSIRTLSFDLHINPNTTQKAVTQLIKAGVLEVHPGQGCFISELPLRPDRKILDPLVEKLLIEATQQGLEEDEIIALIQAGARKLKRA